ncbi:hypothetical protein [Paenibacillus sp. UASWS1643]|uniref:hypothetical protein n=1 Tax=Paenibacillus sp. UASWS1643 TaxID=2580422 RepID=UPI00123AECAE|nr:hypothetical protein [Paenibacillus sp. UASWS1643]KAA8757717.1 hypothetical protein FE296_00460 [Paenibacillus sp. UASWS1643]
MESKEKPSRLTVYLPEKARADLLQISLDTGLSQSQLVVLATHSLIANHNAKGNAIFSELLGIGSNFNGNELQKKG